MCKNNNTLTLTLPECDSKVDLDYPSFFQALSLFLCIVVFHFTTNEYVQDTFTNILTQIHSVRELLANAQAPLRLAVHVFASQIYAAILVIPRTAFQNGTTSLAEMYSKTVSHVISHVPQTIQQNSAIASNKVTSAFTFCSSVLQTYFSATVSYLNGLVGGTSVLQPYLGIVASNFSVPYTKATLFISNPWSRLKIRQIVIRLPFQSGNLEHLAVLGSQPCTKDTSLRDVMISMIRALYNSLVAAFLKTTFFLSQLTMLGHIKIILFLAYLVFAVACLKHGQRFFDKIVWFCLAPFLTLLEGGNSRRALGFCLRVLRGLRTGLPRELRCTLYLVYSSRAYKWLSTTVPRLSKAISRVARYTQALLQDPSPIHLGSYICGVGRYASAWFQDRSPNRLSSYISRLGQQTKAWLRSLFTTPDFKLLSFSTMTFLIDLIVEPLRRRVMGGYPTRPWPPTSAIKSLVSHIALLLVGLVQDIRKRPRRFSCVLRTTWQYLSLVYPGGLHYNLRLTIASTVADIIDVLITLVCLAVFLAIALGYQVILFTMAVRLLEKMFSVSVFNQVDYGWSCA